VRKRIVKKAARYTNSTGDHFADKSPNIIRHIFYSCARHQLYLFNNCHMYYMMTKPLDGKNYRYKKGKWLTK